MTTTFLFILPPFLMIGGASAMAGPAKPKLEGK